MKQGKGQYIQTELGKIPIDWNISSICEIGEIVTGSTPKTIIKDYYGNEFLWATIPDLNGTKYVEKTRTMLSKKGSLNVRKIPPKSILVACIGSIGKIGISSMEMSTNQQINSIICKKQFDNEFIYYQLLNNQKRIQNLANQVAVPIINKTNFGQLKIIKPNNIIEQEKIASILSNVDELIQKTGQIIEQIKNLKKGLMQKLLTKGIGHSKFKKSGLGEIPEEWKIVKVTDICQGIVPGRNKPRHFNGNIPWITIEDIDEMYVKDSKKGLRLTKEEVRNCSGKIIPSNSVIMTCVGELGIVGIAVNDIVINQQLHAFVCSDKIIPYYLANFLKSQKKYMYSIATTTTIPYMNKNNCNSIPIALPSIKEQNKITEVLKNVDFLYKSKQSQKTTLLNLKKSLMQQLLTGKIRVKV